MNWKKAVLNSLICMGLAQIFLIPTNILILVSFIGIFCITKFFNYDIISTVLNEKFI